MDKTQAPIRRILEKEDNFLVASHEHPDGDAMGSTIAMGYLLQHLGKKFCLFNPSGMPDFFSWLETPLPVCTTMSECGDFSPDWYIIMDCGDPFRAGKELLTRVERSQILNIDHHVGNPLFGVENWVDPGRAAVGEMVGVLCRDLDIPLSGPLGEAIYLAIVSDTGNFCYGNTKPETMEMAAEIVRLGLAPGDFSSKYQNQWSSQRLKLWSEVLGMAQMHYHGKIAASHVTQEMLQRTATTKHDCDGLVEFLRRVKGVLVSMILREEKDGTIKFSLRSQGEVNVQRIARVFDGGGHRNAAGGLIKASVFEAQKQLLETSARLLQLDPEEKDTRDLM